MAPPDKIAPAPAEAAAAREPGFWDGVAHSYIPPAELRISSGLELHRDADAEVDPITHEVIRYALLHANLEHSALIQRLCVSPITMLTRDFQTSVLTEDGELVFLGPNLQYFSNSHSLSVKWTLENRSENPGIAPGDVYLSNDPFVGAPHQPDTSLLGPVFVDGRLFCWVANSLHYADVGGSMPGSFCIDAEDTWAEPMSWPPVKLIEGGRVRREIEELFARQSRLPHALLMDLHAAIAALGSAQRRITELVERYGAAAVKTVMQRKLNAAGIVVAKMLACADGDVRELALGPCIPHFYGTIQGGADAAGNIFIFPNTDGMMGSLGAMPQRDGVDVGGHFWIPDGIASNCEDLEAQYPLLILSRRLLEPGADGAGRQRGGLGFVETTVTRGALAFQVALYANESFTKAQGLFGGNPGTR